MKSGLYTLDLSGLPGIGSVTLQTYRGTENVLYDVLRTTLRYALLHMPGIVLCLGASAQWAW